MPELATLFLLLGLLLGGPALAQAPAEPEPAPTGGEARRIGDPYEAYAAGAYDQALQGFVDRQVERPEDPALSLNVGSAHYKMGNYAEAERAFAQAAAAGDQALREQALYNLGNTAFRQGQLEQAVELYKQALELDPDDEDAKFNLEFVRDEIRRRHEEAKKRQEEQQKQQGDQQGQQGQQQQQDQQGQGEQQEQGQQGGQDQKGQDSDQDGLADTTERSGANPTDPQNPDTDGDGLPEAREDQNRNGQVDPGETDPNKADTDGDGMPDGQDPQPTQAGEGSQGSGQEAQDAEAAEAREGEGRQLSKEEAERFLQALEEARPQKGHPQRGRPSRPAKDW